MPQDELRELFALGNNENTAHLSSELGVRRYVKQADSIKKRLVEGKIMDWGCGYGQMTFLLKNRGLEVVSYDVCRAGEDLLNRIGQKLILARDPVKLPFKDGTFDAVLSSGTLEHVEEPLGALKEIYRVLKSNGYLFVFMLPNKYSYVEFISDFFRRGDHPVKYSMGKIINVLNSLGFKILDSGYQNFFPYNLKGFPKTIKDIYHNFDNIIEKADDLFTVMPFIRNFSTNVMVTARKRIV